MKKRHKMLAWMAALSLVFAGGCETTSTGGGEATGGARKEGGNVRSNPFHPPMPSEIERADYRYW